MKITPKSEDGNSGGTIDNKNQMEEINNAITLYYLKFIKDFREALDGEFGKGTKSFPAAILNPTTPATNKNTQETIVISSPFFIALNYCSRKS